MAEVHVFSLKVGTSHGLWQYKLSGTHDRVIMHGMRRILDKTCQLLGYDESDRSAVYLFHFSAEPFEGSHVSLRKLRETTGGECYYRVVASNIGRLTADGLLPAIVRTSYLHAWPEVINFRLEKSMTGAIVS